MVCPVFAITTHISSGCVSDVWIMREEVGLFSERISSLPGAFFLFKSHMWGLIGEDLHFAFSLPGSVWGGEIKASS